MSFLNEEQLGKSSKLPISKNLIQIVFNCSLKERRVVLVTHDENKAEAVNPNTTDSWIEIEEHRIE